MSRRSGVVAHNAVAMLTGYLSADQRIIACANQDVAYGAGFFDNLDTEPIVFQVPDFGDANCFRNKFSAARVARDCSSSDARRPTSASTRTIALTAKPTRAGSYYARVRDQSGDRIRSVSWLNEFEDHTDLEVDAIFAEDRSLMPICPMCHSKLTADLDVRPSILPASLWRCGICFDVWKEVGAIRPRSDQPHLIKADALRRRKTDALSPAEANGAKQRPKA